MRDNNGGFIFRNLRETVVNFGFLTEEYFLETVKYPYAANHRLLHREYTSKLAGIERECSSDKDPHLLMGSLKKWWLGHICEEDMLFKHYFD